ncbi:hypothetical protein [Bacillus sp. (in: firmicutes)]|nr:hypothetical protein [Bacillus sp. (in: firmicutes)]MDU2391290.1 hypothetical protein [Bacillus sp. (in: firmicutes)]
MSYLVMKSIKILTDIAEKRVYILNRLPGMKGGTWQSIYGKML